jgi:hypothetical protein
MHSTNQLYIPRNNRLPVSDIMENAQAAECPFFLLDGAVWFTPKHPWLYKGHSEGMEHLLSSLTRDMFI